MRRDLLADGTPRGAFCAEHCKVLRREHFSALLNLKLTTEQIRSIDACLPVPSALMSKSATTTEVVEGLTDLLNKLKAAAQSVERLTTGPLPHQREIFNHLLAAGWYMEDEWGWWFFSEPGAPRLSTQNHVFDGALECLINCHVTATLALEMLDRAQRRPNAINPYVVRQIDHVLMGLGVKQLKRSSSPTSMYSRVMRICFEAMGREKPNPERAIKDFLLATKTGRAKMWDPKSLLDESEQVRVVDSRG